MRPRLTVHQADIVLLDYISPLSLYVSGVGFNIMHLFHNTCNTFTISDRLHTGQVLTSLDHDGNPGCGDFFFSKGLISRDVKKVLLYFFWSSIPQFTTLCIQSVTLLKMQRFTTRLQLVPLCRYNCIHNYSIKRVCHPVFIFLLVVSWYV